jgi:hypothetical protein
MSSEAAGEEAHAVAEPALQAEAQRAEPLAPALAPVAAQRQGEAAAPSPGLGEC